MSKAGELRAAKLLGEYVRSQQAERQTAEFCKGCYHWANEPKIVKLCPLHAATPALLAALKAVRALEGFECCEPYGKLVLAAIAATEGEEIES